MKLTFCGLTLTWALALWTAGAGVQATAAPGARPAAGYLAPERVVQTMAGPDDTTSFARQLAALELWRDVVKAFEQPSDGSELPPQSRLIFAAYSQAWQTLHAKLPARYQQTEGCTRNLIDLLFRTCYQRELVEATSHFRDSPAFWQEALGPHLTTKELERYTAYRSAQAAATQDYRQRRGQQLAREKPAHVLDGLTPPWSAVAAAVLLLMGVLVPLGLVLAFRFSRRAQLAIQSASPWPSPAHVGALAVTCVHCGSGNVRRFAVIVEEGTSSRTSTSTTSGTYSGTTGSAPDMGSFHGSTTTTSTERTALARRCAPPEEPSHPVTVFLGMVVLSALASAGLLLALGFVDEFTGRKVWHFFGSSANFAVGVSVVWVAGSVVGIYAARAAADRRAAYPALRRAWDRSWLCLQCGGEYQAP